MLWLMNLHHQFWFSWWRFKSRNVLLMLHVLSLSKQSTRNIAMGLCNFICPQLISCVRRVTMQWPSFFPSLHVVSISLHAGWPHRSYANPQTRVAEDQAWRKVKGRCTHLKKKKKKFYFQHCIKLCFICYFKALSLRFILQMVNCSAMLGDIKVLRPCHVVPPCYISCTMWLPPLLHTYSCTWALYSRLLVAMLVKYRTRFRSCFQGNL